MSRAEDREVRRRAKRLIEVIEDLGVDGYFERIPLKRISRFDTALTNLRQALVSAETEDKREQRDL